MALLECKNLTLGYDGRQVLCGLSFKVEQGDYLCILGDNGSGKTTLMKTILGLHSPIEGEVVTGEGLLRSEIGYLPQQTQVQRDFPASVREIVMSGFAGRGLHFRYTKTERQICDANMEKMGITHLARRCYRELSGGQQQRVLLARALCSAGKMLLLDEPVAGLDPHVTFEMYDLIEKLNREDNITIIMISHDVAAAQKYADHILHIGDPMFFGRTEDYIECDCCRREHGTKGAV